MTVIFQHTLWQVLSETKTQTRRIVKTDERAIRGKNNQIVTVMVNGREKWTVGKTYAVQSARGKSSVARIKITRIRCERLDRIHTVDAVAEGFSSRPEFLMVWDRIHGERARSTQVWVLEFELVGILVDRAFLSAARVFARTTG